MDKKRILIATYPFGKSGSKPLDILEQSGHELVFNPYKRRLKQGEVEDIIQDIDVVIAGTEPYDEPAMANATRLKAICRVGIGLDSVDLIAARNHAITVSYTPDAPSQGVAELTVANMLNLARHIPRSDKSVRESAWNRYIGFLLRELTIGIVGVGRIGKIVTRLLQPFGARILACDLEPDLEFGRMHNLEWCDKERIFHESDLVSVHIPHNARNHHYVDRMTIASMKTDSMLINTSRGPIVEEGALADALLQGHLGGAALDVFEKEPYEGVLTKMDNVVLTAHMGASARESRYLMELGAAEDCLRFLNNEPLENPVPESEYDESNVPLAALKG